MRARALLLAPVLLALGGCGNYLNVEWNGQSGVSHDADGNLILHVLTCDNSTSRVEVVAGREGLDASDVNPTIGAFTSPEPANGYVEINLANPDPWVVEQELQLPDNPEHYFILSTHLDNPGGPSLLRAERFVSDAALNQAALQELPAGVITTGEQYDPNLDPDAHAPLETLTAEEFASGCDTRDR